MSSRHSICGWLSFGSAAALFCSFVLLPVSFAAEEPTPIEEVVVTGFKQSIATAVEEKRKSAEIVDVIKADDIASFPDNNLAEAIQRIPGVSIERDSGQGRSITVRGLGEDFVRTRLNGMEALATTTGSTLGSGVNRSRGFDFSTFASELTGITSSSITDNRSVQEKDNGGYIQFDFDMDVPLGMKLRGNVGTRFVRTSQSALGYLSATQPVNVERSYNDWLPALNLDLEVTPEIITRVGVSKGMSRPTLNFLSPGGTLTLTGTQPAANIGNPDLQPFRSNNYDLSVEWYPTHGSLLSAAFFYKSVKNYIQRLQVVEPYAATGLPISLLGAGQDTATPFLVTTYLNTPGGFVKGVELNYQQAFTFLPAPFNRFGSLLNYTHVSSETTYYLAAVQNASVLKAPFVNVSPDSVNATLFYEDRRFSARVSGAYRGNYLRTVPIRTGLPDTAGSFSTFNLDATVGYALTDHLSLRVDALNLTDQPSDYWNGQTRQAQTVYSHTGRQYYFGAQFKY